MVPLKLRSPGNASSSSRAADDAPQGRNGRRGLEMILSDVKDRVLRNKLGELQTEHPLTPLLFLVYTLLKCDQDLECARIYLGEDNSPRRDFTAIPVTSLHAIRNVNMREKVRDITESLGTTVWWTLYALLVCNGSVDQASGLLTEGVIDATVNPWWSGMNVDTVNEIYTGSAELEVETPEIDIKPKISASPYDSPPLGDSIAPPIGPDANQDTGRKKEKTGSVIHDNSDDEMTFPPAKNEGPGGSMSPSTVATSDIEEDQIEKKIRQMRQVLPHLTPPQCINSLELSDGDVSKAIFLELEVSEESLVDHHLRTRFSPSSNSAVQPQKRKSLTPDDGVRKKLCFHDSEKDAAVLPEAGQWVRSIFHQLAGTTVTINLADAQTREVPQGFLVEHSAYFKEQLEGNGKQPAVTEIDFSDVKCNLFDLVIQYMICRNVSFGDVPTLTSGFIRDIIELMVFSTRLEIRGMSTLLLTILEDTLREARENLMSILKAVHIHTGYKNFGKHHPIRKLLVKACVKPYMKERTDYNNSDSDCDSDDSASDDEEGKNLDIDMDVISRQDGHLAYKFNRAFKFDLILAADKTRRNRESRPRNPHSRSFTNVVTWYTDPLDSKQFTLE
ncbi:hypothetical protein CJF30_00009634 [Rutstroemia sp. NJR-2017a BBW]|nr:hypothetical protein CJF30_00009634 [Rutstroemia sp. NJR-2017a BBW]